MRNVTMKVSPRKFAVGLSGVVAIALAVGSPGVSAETYPAHNVTVIIPFAPGNANDITGRILFEQLGRQVGQAFIIDNRGGAGGTIGVGQAARATPDGYTILFHSASFSSAYVTHKTLPYDTFKDFIAVAPAGISPSVLVVSPTSGYKTAADLVAAAKAKPGALNFASAGIGAASHLAAEKFNVAAGIKSQHVPFKGPVEALTEVMAGRIDYYFLPIAPALALIKDGKVRALAVSSDKRAPLLPDVPTTSEIGYPKAAYAFWNGVFVPAKTPADIVKKLYDETTKAVEEPAVKARLATLGIVPLTMSQSEFQKYFEADVKDTDVLAKAAGIERQ
jgi:tripartite-type tricarboxylate transporter receptor subunit TctC